MVIINLVKKKKKSEREGMRLGKYELGRTLGEGNFGKVKFARNTDSGQAFAVKIIDKNTIVDINITNQVLLTSWFGSLMMISVTYKNNNNYYVVIILF